MKSLLLFNVRAGYQVSFCLLLTLAASPSPTHAQTNAAAEAVRQRVEGLDRTGGGGREAAPAPSRESAPIPERSTGEYAASGFDLSYVPSDAVAVAVLRPAKFMTSPLGKLLPTEVMSAYGVKMTGFDPAKMGEVVAFYQMAGESPGYGIITKFNEPFKGSAIPASLRGTAKVGDFNGRKYLQASDPTGNSFFGPDNKTLIVGSDALVRQAVAAKDQPKAGPLFEKLKAAPATSDAYVAVDVVSLRPMMAMVQMLAQQSPQLQPLLEIPNLVTAAEMTFDAAAPSPMTIVIYANDDASAERIESILSSTSQVPPAQERGAVAGDANDPVAQAVAAYAKRFTETFVAPKREGSKLTFFQTDGTDAHEKQLILATTLGLVIGKVSSMLESHQGPPGMPPGAPFGEGGPPHIPPGEHGPPPESRDPRSDG